MYLIEDLINKTFVMSINSRTENKDLAVLFNSIPEAQKYLCDNFSDNKLSFFGIKEL